MDPTQFTSWRSAPCPLFTAKLPASNISVWDFGSCRAIQLGMPIENFVAFPWTSLVERIVLFFVVYYWHLVQLLQLVSTNAFSNSVCFVLYYVLIVICCIQFVLNVSWISWNPLQDLNNNLLTNVIGKYNNQFLSRDFCVSLGAMCWRQYRNRTYFCYSGSKSQGKKQYALHYITMSYVHVLM